MERHAIRQNKEPNILKLDNDLIIKKVSNDPTRYKIPPRYDVSVTGIPYNCDILTNHCRWCGCSTPRLHTYLAIKHRCDSYCATAYVEETLDMQNDGPHDLADMESNYSDRLSPDSDELFDSMEILEEKPFVSIEPGPSSYESTNQNKHFIRKNNHATMTNGGKISHIDSPKKVNTTRSIETQKPHPMACGNKSPTDTDIFGDLSVKQEPRSPKGSDLSVADFHTELQTVMAEVTPETSKEPISAPPRQESISSFASLLQEDNLTDNIKSEQPEDNLSSAESPGPLQIDEDMDVPQETKKCKTKKSATVSFINPVKIKINFKTIEDTQEIDSKNTPAILNTYSLAPPKLSPSDTQKISKVDVPPSLDCMICKILFPNFEKLQQHLEVHQKDGIILCYYCQKSFSDKTSMKRHMRVHTGERPYECKICGKKFSLPGNFKKHRDIHLNVRSEPCRICQKTFRRKEHLKHHMLTHTGEKPFKCTRCPSTFTARYSLQIHMNIHLNHRPYSCTFCSKTFTDKSTMRKHIRVHTGEKPFSCSVCGKRFGESGTLASHMCIHTDSRPYACDKCELTFKNIGRLKQHEKIHTGEKRFTCKYCGTKFMHKYNKDMHERIHTGLKPYKCSNCELTFRSRSCLGKHMLSHNPVCDRKFACTHCSKRFYRRCHLKRHLDMHLGIKSFCCEKCGKSFSSKATLKKHMKTFHVKGARQFPCEVCGKIFKRKTYVASHVCLVPVKNEPEAEPIDFPDIKEENVDL